MADADAQHTVGYVSARGTVDPGHGTKLPVHNPATGELTATAHEVSPQELDDVVEQAHSVFTSTWRGVDPSERGRLVAAWADAIDSNRDALADLEVSDVGHLRRETMGDIQTCVRVLRYYAGMADKLEGRSFAQVPERLAYGADEPYGVVAGINPYNGNAVFIAFKAGPAIVAGNCIVLKAPEVAPLLHFRLAELALESGIPPGVVNVVTGRGDVVGPLLTTHPGIGMVAFTGGPGAGREVIAQSARNIVPVALELGGKSPAILLPDADLDTAIPSVLHSNFVKSGQSCVAGSRILVHESMYQQVCAALAATAGRIRVGLPTDPASHMGTLISRAQREHVDGLVKRAVAAGARCLSGGAPLDRAELAGGSFYQPTVLADVADDNPAAVTEAFGPMASVLSYRDVDEALARANATQYGLSAQIWGNDASVIQYLARNLVAGSIWINTYRAFHPTVPFGGMKESGFGRENGFAAIQLYTRHKSVVWDLSTDRVLPYS
ncbi:aldehyde dehydrogenase family protein [Amycolatopsis sp. K13G38]|uniref:Aldehyde dehydrogenase family protein n=2 Tax=Amycolatopsis acididurans TaxID=2724524 RepID=A0ABX1JAJ1_9PSEU|nr:aldehyde dehydrogenase family protein [Amycolatopsis acididurans]